MTLLAAGRNRRGLQSLADPHTRATVELSTPAHRLWRPIPLLHWQGVPTDCDVTTLAQTLSAFRGET